MGSLEKFTLHWNDFEENLSRSFAGIRDLGQFFDCTLITDDEEELYSDNLQAHKVILSGCSAFFKNILTKESICAHPNPLIYLGGISAKNLKYILDFMYHGEVNVARDELDKFLEVAKTLKIKGLTQNSNGSRSSKRPAASFTSLPLPVLNQSCKKSRVRSAGTFSQSTKSNPAASVQTEVNPSAHVGAAEDLEDMIGMKNEFCEDEKDSKEEYDGSNDSDDPLLPGTTGWGEDDSCGADDMTKNENELKNYKGRHLNGTQRITLVNLIKTMDNENILRARNRKRDHETQEKKNMLWKQVVPAFNEICGINCDAQKLDRTLRRIKSTPKWKSHSILYDIV